MTPRTHGDRIADILVAIADIRADTQGMNLAAFGKNAVVVRSVLYSIAGLRDRIVHEYFRTNTRRIWDVVQDDLDPLEAALQSSIQAVSP